MDDLNEFNLLHCLHVRKEKGQIYTQVGSQILVAVNPYRECPELYSQAQMEYYRRQLESVVESHQKRDLEPHLFKVA